MACYGDSYPYSSMTLGQIPPNREVTPVLCTLKTWGNGGTAPPFLIPALDVSELHAAAALHSGKELPVPI
jgi:hypothetical protein